MTEIFVERDPAPTQQKGDWIIRIGRGQGGKIRSRHRHKSRAISIARKEGRKREDRGATLYIQGKFGRAKKEADYGGGHPGSRGLFGLF